MKNNFYKALFLFTLSLFAVSCSNDDDNHDDHDHDSAEHTYVRILLSDEKTTELTLFDPSEDKISSFTAKFPKSSLYTTESGRFAGIVHRDNNFVETFDSGLELHGDHIYVYHFPKFLILT